MLFSIISNNIVYNDRYFQSCRFPKTFYAENSLRFMKTRCKYIAKIASDRVEIVFFFPFSIHFYPFRYYVIILLLYALIILTRSYFITTNEHSSVSYIMTVITKVFTFYRCTAFLETNNLDVHDIALQYEHNSYRARIAGEEGVL